MPLPERKTDETRDQFIDRCMADATMIREFPEAAQRRAVCERQASAGAPRRAQAAGALNFFSEPGALTIEAAGDAQGADGKPRLPRFVMVAYTGGPMRIQGWRYPVIVDLAGMHIPAPSRPIRFGHDPTSGVGHTDSIGVRDGKLVAAGVVSRDTAIAREIVVSAGNGFPWQASIGASVEQFEFVKEGQSVLVNGREFKGPVNVIRKATLGEISFVDLGADANTSASVAASAREKGIMDPIENVQTDQNTPEAEGTETPATAGQRDRAQAGAAAAEPPDTEAPGAPQGEPAMARSTQAAAPRTVNAAADPGIVADAVAEMRAKAAAEQRRINAIRKVCGDKHPDICARAIDEGWDLTRTELEVLRADRPPAPAVHVPDNSMTGAVLEAACMLTGGVRGDAVAASYGEKAVEAADKRYKGGIGLQELLLEAAWANGYDGRNFRDSRAVLRFAFGQNLSAGFSNVDIGGILSNVANKFLLEG
ncbi:MAG TPA: hypothetical protein PK082_02090, partial [Phycisphaerae bacterium]|nr:hypothetical protein [Phycisphaerae bacterium]